MLGKRTAASAATESRGAPRRTIIFLVFAAIGMVSLMTGGALSPGAGLAQPATPSPLASPPAVTSASPQQLEAAQSAWSRTRHANTFDNGMGANTTCASCKSPMNWDPAAVAAEAAHDCSSCKREPGKPRPELPGGVKVARSDWKSITCGVCHQPIGNSYSTALAFWDQATRQYQPVTSATELCGKCHEGRHGFEVVWEQTNSPAHKNWACTKCHGSHGAPVKCTDCHDVANGPNATVHAQHAAFQVNCTACHDAAGLTIWQDPNSDSRHFGEYAPQRFGHALRSWPSHDLQRAADCRRCHHPTGDVMPKAQPIGAAPKVPVVQAALVPSVPCDNAACHPGGATFEWCPIFPRDSSPETKKP